MIALLIVDIQNGLTKNKNLFNDSVFIETVVYTLKKFREKQNTVIFIQHNNKQLTIGTKEWEIDSRIELNNDDNIIQKKHGNAFVQTNLKSILDNKCIEKVLICGLVTHGCVKATCIGAIDEGYTTALLKNGHSNWNKDAEFKITSTELDLKKLGVRTIDREEI